MLACLSPNGRATYRLDELPMTLLVGSINGIVSLRRDADSGTWYPQATSLDGMQVNALVSEPKTGLVFAGTAGHGLYASADQGVTWEPHTFGLHDRHVFAMALDDRAEQPVLYAGMLPPALYRSDDLGRTWQELPSLKSVPGAERWEFRAPPGAAHVKNIAFHPTDRATLYVCIEQGGLVVSTDGGATWDEIDTWCEADDFFYRDSHRLAVSQRQPEIMYMATGDGLCKTSDGGRTWTRLTTGRDRVGYPDSVFIDPASDEVVYVAGAGGHPGTWTQATARPGVICSTNAGLTWDTCMHGLPDPLRGNIEAMSQVATSEGVSFYIGTAVGEVWSSDDRAKNWRLIAELAPISKAGHYRKFLGPEERAQAERELQRQTADFTSGAGR